MAVCPDLSPNTVAALCRTLTGFPFNPHGGRAAVENLSIPTFLVARGPRDKWPHNEGYRAGAIPRVRAGEVTSVPGAEVPHDGAGVAEVQGR